MKGANKIGNAFIKSGLQRGQAPHYDAAFN